MKKLILICLVASLLPAAFGAQIIKDSEVLEDLRDHSRTIRGPCASCEEAERCYGCRGAAYRLTGDYLASDPLCWKNVDRQDEIAHLPFPAGEIIPQKSPMRVVATLSAEMPFAREDGGVDEAVHFEIMAQSIAALNGFKHLGRSASSPEGYLVGAQGFEILGSVQVGDRLPLIRVSPPVPATAGSR